MNLRPHRREDPEVNLTPLIDIVFLLLIFFMVSTTFIKESELKVKLPEASLEPVVSQPQALEIAIDIEGRYAVNHRVLPDKLPETLLTALLDAADSESRQNEGGQQLPVVIRADAQTVHQAVVTALDVAGRAGFTQLSIVTINATATAADSQ